jgi:Tol biopolymer transport system component
MDTDGQNVRRLTDNSAHDWRPAWSPDGTRIAFMSLRDGSQDLYVMDTTGEYSRVTNDTAEDFEPAWRPVAPVPNTTAPSIDSSA